MQPNCSEVIIVSETLSRHTSADLLMVISFYSRTDVKKQLEVMACSFYILYILRIIDDQESGSFMAEYQQNLSLTFISSPYLLLKAPRSTLTQLRQLGFKANGKQSSRQQRRCGSKLAEISFK